MKHKVWLLLLVMCTLVLLLSVDGPVNTFAQTGAGPTLTITIDPPEGGTVNQINTGTIVELEVVPNEGWRFIGWTGPDAKACEEGTFIFIWDVHCTANFSEKYFVLISIEPSGSINRVDQDPTGRDGWFPVGYPIGTTVILTPVVAPHFYFEGWTGRDRNECAQQQDDVFEVTLTDHDIMCTALFSLELPVPPDNHRWMTAIAPAIADRRLRDVVLPGSHDAGTYSFGQTSEYTDADPIDAVRAYEGYIPDGVWNVVKDVADLVGIIAKDITAGWARTQSGNIQWQLEAGIRYFDLRFMQETDGRLYIHHGKLRGQNDRDDIFRQVKDFLDAPGHEQEIIILDLSEWRDVDTEHHREFLNELLKVFKEKMIPAAHRNATLREIWALEGKPQLVVRYDELDESWFNGDENYKNTDAEDLARFWPRVSSKVCGKHDPFMCRPWAAAREWYVLRNYTEDEMYCPCCSDDYHYSDQLFMLQGIYTPDEPFIKCGLRKLVDSWLSDFKWVCDVPIAGSAACAGANEALKIIGCEKSEAYWGNLPTNLYQLAIGPREPGDGTPDTISRVTSWWQNCENRTRNNLNIIAVDFIEADYFDVVHESIKINLGFYNTIPILDALPDLQSQEGSQIDLSVGFTKGDTCDRHTATIEWGDDSELETAKVYDIVGDAFPDKLEGSHVYADNGLYDVNVCIKDGPPPTPAVPFISEFHAANVGDDIDEKIEITGEAGTDLSGWSLALYEGTDDIDGIDGIVGKHYETIAIDGIIPDLHEGFGTIVVPAPGLKDGSVLGNGIALMTKGNATIQFICYGGVYPALDYPVGPAVPPEIDPTDPKKPGELGLVESCIDIGVKETGSEEAGQSLQSRGIGNRYEDFRDGWQPPAIETFAEINPGLTLRGDRYSYSETCDTFQIDVANVAPTVEAGSDVTIDEAGEVILDPAKFNDLGTLDTHTAIIDWGDILPPDPINMKPGVVSESPFGPPGSTDGADGTVAGSFVYGDNSIYIVEVCVTDNDGGEGCDELVVTVNNVDPTLFFDKSAAISFAGGSAFLARRGVEQTFNSTAADIGSDDLTYAWTFPPSALGSLKTYFNDDTTPDPPHSPHGEFPFETSDSNKTTFTVPGVYEATIDIYDDDTGHMMDSLPLLMTDSRGCTDTFSTWGHQYGVGGKQTIDDLRLQGYLDLIRFASAYFDDGNLANLQDAQAIFSANGSSDANHLKQHALAAWQNFASGGVLWNQQIRHLDGPFHEAIGEIDAVLLDPDATKKELVDAQQDAIRINTSKSGNSSCNDAGAP